MVLGTEHQAALTRKIALAVYAAKLDDAKRDAVALGLTDDASRLDAMICAALTGCQDAQAIIEAWERQETERTRTRDSRTTARIFEQLMLRPAGAVL